MNNKDSKIYQIESRLYPALRDAIPQPPPEPIQWMEESLELPGSARSRRFNISITPWLRDPILAAITDLFCRIVTLVKPVQSGGSVMGEAILSYWIRWLHRSFLQYNWSNDKRAVERWDSRVKSVLLACKEIAKMIAQLPPDQYRKGEIEFDNIFFRMQGAFVSTNLDSDSVPLQINEEIHDWPDGHLDKARNRATAVWDAKSVDISNASKVGDQLHKAFNAGTMQYWEVCCPGCSNPNHSANFVYHRLRAEWDDRHPNLGGLRYNGEESRIVNGYDYNRLVKTIRYQMPCGYLVHDDVMERRALSLSAKYSDPTNTGADGTHRSYTYEAVSVDYIPWLSIIKKKHSALLSLRLGDPEPWKKYRMEVECLFWDMNEAPTGGRVEIVSNTSKDIAGLPEPRVRAFALDKQEGQKDKGELPHWWMLIRDLQIYKQEIQNESGNFLLAGGGFVSPEERKPDDKVIFEYRLRSLLVYENKHDTDEEVIGILKDHNCKMWQGVADSGDDTTHVYMFCMKYGINAIKGRKADSFTHPNGAKRIFSKEVPLHTMLRRPPMFAYIPAGKGLLIPDPREPLFWSYSKIGIREKLHFLRANTEHITPADVSDDYIKHNEAEERVKDTLPSGEVVWNYIQHRERNDQYVNECYIAMIVDQSGMLGAIVNPGNKNESNQKNNP
jgi:hypothetical protein